jgi:hypothetical protein
MESSIPRSRELSADEVLNIRSIRLNFPYNFAQPPSPKIHWNLSDLINHSTFPVAKLDATDKWGIQYFPIDNFLRLIYFERINEPASISAYTVAKLVSYVLQIVESTTESIESVTGFAAFNGDDIFAHIRRLADDMQIEDDLSPWRHFWIATKHPTVRWAVNNAVMNRWGAVGYEKSA